MVNFGLLTAETGWRVGAHQQISISFVSSLFSRYDQQHSTEGARYIPLGEHHIGHRPIF